MQTAIIYTKSTCPFCVRAKELLDKKKVKYAEINIENDEKMLEDMIKKSEGRKTVPQIFIGDKHIGGCDDLYALDMDGKLDVLLEQ